MGVWDSSSLKTTAVPPPCGVFFYASTSNSKARTLLYPLESRLFSHRVFVSVRTSPDLVSFIHGTPEDGLPWGNNNLRRAASRRRLLYGSEKAFTLLLTYIPPAEPLETPGSNILQTTNWLRQNKLENADWCRICASSPYGAA